MGFATEEEGMLCVLTMHMSTNLKTTYITIYNIYTDSLYSLSILPNNSNYPSNLV